MRTTVSMDEQLLNAAKPGSSRFDHAGNHLWSQRFGGTNSQIPLSIAATTAGEILLSGYFDGTIDFGGGPLVSQGDDVFVAKLDSNGNHIWSRRYGDANQDRAHAIAVDPSGNVLVAGEFEGQIDFGGGPLLAAGGLDAFLLKLDANGTHVWSQSFGDGAAQSASGVDADGAGSSVLVGYMAGTTTFGGASFTATGEDGFIARFAP